jgi:hypothetical protein
MTVLTEKSIHVHSSFGLPCAACGTADDGVHAFVINVGYWNTLNTKCTPKMLRPDYIDSHRDDPKTSALLGDRLPNPTKVSGDQK